MQDCPLSRADPVTVIEGMGHDLAHGGVWPAIVEAVATHTLHARPIGGYDALS
jgi:hypothetical protein